MPNTYTQPTRTTSIDKTFATNLKKSRENRRWNKTTTTTIFGFTFSPWCFTSVLSLRLL